MLPSFFLQTNGLFSRLYLIKQKNLGLEILKFARKFFDIVLIESVKSKSPPLENTLTLMTLLNN